VLSGEETNIHFIVLGLTRLGLYPRSTTLGVSMLTITPPMGYAKNTCPPNPTKPITFEMNYSCIFFIQMTHEPWMENIKVCSVVHYWPWDNGDMNIFTYRIRKQSSSRQHQPQCFVTMLVPLVILPPVTIGCCHI
jgi:hypothetical protein